MIWRRVILMVVIAEINTNYYLPRANGQASIAGALAWGVRGVLIHLEPSTTTTEASSTANPGMAFVDTYAARRRKIAALALRDAPPRRAGDSWRRTVGRFQGDQEMQDIWEAGRRLREADRLP